MKLFTKVKTIWDNLRENGELQRGALFKMLLLIGIPVLVIVILVYLGHGNRVADSWPY